MPESNVDEVRARFAATAERVADHSRQQIEMVREQVRTFVAPSGDERVLDAGTGAGTLALALAPLVREVVGIDAVPELLEAARAKAPANATFVKGDATSLPFDSFSFDVAATRRTLHHIARSARRARGRPLRARARPVPHAAAARRRLPEPVRGERARVGDEALPDRTARARLLPRARRLHRKRAGAGSCALPRGSRGIRRRIGLVRAPSLAAVELRERPSELCSLGP